MSAFGGKADMAVCGCPLSRSLLGVKRTSSVALHMSANDPKRTSWTPSRATAWIATMSHLSLGGDDNEATRLRNATWRNSGRVAARGASATAGPDAAGQRVTWPNRKRSITEYSPQGVPIGYARFGVDRRTQRADRLPVCRRQFGFD